MSQGLGFKVSEAQARPLVTLSEDPAVEHSATSPAQGLLACHHAPTMMTMD